MVSILSNLFSTLNILSITIPLSLCRKVKARHLNEEKHKIVVNRDEVRGDIAEFWYQNWYGNV